MSVVVDQMISLMSKKDQESMTSLAGRSFVVGSLCSGTDVCMNAMQALAKAANFSVEHKMSCEIAPNIQRWILLQCDPPPTVLFSDVMDLESGGGFCIRNQRRLGGDQSTPNPDNIHV